MSKEETHHLRRRNEDLRIFVSSFPAFGGTRLQWDKVRSGDPDDRRTWRDSEKTLQAGAFFPAGALFPRSTSMTVSSLKVQGRATERGLLRRLLAHGREGHVGVGVYICKGSICDGTRIARKRTAGKGMRHESRALHFIILRSFAAHKI